MTGARQAFKTTDVLRLEIETDLGADFTNLAVNPGGALAGGFGWTASYAGETVNGLDGPERIEFYSPLSALQTSLISERFSVRPGQYVSLSYTLGLVGAPNHDVTVNFYSDDAYLSQSVSGIRTTGTYTHQATAAPAGTTRATVRFGFYANTSRAVPTAAVTATLTNFKIVARDNSTAVVFSQVPLRPTFTNVLGSSHDLSIKRAPLDVGTLTATIRDVALDPATSTLIQPGHACRVMALVSGAWAPIFTGKVLDGSVSYDMDLSVPAPRRANIALTAVDATSVLAQTRRSAAYATLAGVRQVLEGAGVPFVVNGVSAVTGSFPATVAINTGASAIDQIVIARDTARAYAWVDRFGRLIANDAAQMPSALRTTLTDAAVSGASITFSTSDLINEVSVKLARYRPVKGTTDEIDLGPYRDSASIAARGVHSAEYSLQGLTNAQVKTWANAVLAANATPARRAENVLLPLATTTDVTSWATVDLGDLVRVNLATAGLDLSLRVTGVEHTITEGKWLSVLSFTAPSTVAGPIATPSPSIATESFQPLEVVGDVATYTTDSNGDVKIPHGLPGTPLTATATATGLHNLANLRVDATNITLRVRGATGTVQGAGLSIGVSWVAGL